jgi:hypothetical protein
VEQWNMGLKKNLFSHHPIIPTFHPSGGDYSNIPNFPKNDAD